MQKKSFKVRGKGENKMLVMLFFYVQYVCVFSKLLTCTFVNSG